MARTPTPLESALERAIDPLANALKRSARAAPAPTGAGKPGLAVSPLAVPFPPIPPVAGCEMATARAGFYKHERDDLVVFHFPQGASCAGVFTRHKVGSAPVDW